MSLQMVFKRYELKYIMTRKQKEAILRVMEPYMELDKYGRSSIRNIYYDTDTYLLARRSIEKPVYKEKLRIRSYGRATSDSEVFVELKKKYEDIVYKRRVCMEHDIARGWINEGKECGLKSQIVNEINYFMDYYSGIGPKVYLSYEREAYYSKDGSDFRVTFDENILFRQEELSLEADAGGRAILPEDKVLMELKCPGAIPLWMTEVLSSERIYKQSFSKYGTAYSDMFLKAKGE